MIEEVINSIVQAEEKAEKIEKDAIKKSREIITQAEEESKKILKEQELNISNEIKKAEEEAKIIIDKNNKDIINKANKDTLKMRDNCFEKMIEAKDIVKKGLLKKYGCS